MLPHPLTNFEIQKYYQNEPKFNSFYSQNNLSKIKEWEIYNKSWWIWINRNSLDYFLCACWKCNIIDSFGAEHIPKEIRKFIRNKNIIPNIYRIQAYDSVMFGYFCIRFIDFMLKGKSLLECSFSLNECKKNDKITLKYFQ